MINRFIQLHYVIYQLLLVKKYRVRGMEKKGGYYMKFLLRITSCFLLIFTLLPAASMAESGNSTRSTSLGTGLPTSEEKYERPILTPEPTKPPTTEYEFVEDEEETSDDSLLEDDYSEDEDFTMDEEDTTIGDDSTSVNDNTSTSNTDDSPATSTNSNATNSDSNNSIDIAQQEMTELPATGVTNNYWGLLGTIIIIVAVLIFFLFRKKK